MKSRKLPPHTWEAHPLTDKGEMKKPFLIAVITIVILVALVGLLFVGQQFVGKAISTGQGGIFVNQCYVGQECVVPIQASIVEPSVAVSFSLNYPAGITPDCTNIFNYMDERFNKRLASLPAAGSNPLYVVREADCVADTKITFEYAGLCRDAKCSNALMNGENPAVNISEFSFTPAAAGDYVFTFDSFEVWNLSEEPENLVTPSGVTIYVIEEEMCDPACAVDEVCVDGECVAAPEETDCNDGIDDDSDGLTDCLDPDCLGTLGPDGLACCQVNEDCPDLVCGSNYECSAVECTVDATRECGSAVGVCEKGIQICGDDGMWDIDCTGGVTPATELCTDLLDNDCDGFTDCADSDCATDVSCVEMTCTSDTECPATTAESCSGSLACTTETTYTCDAGLCAVDVIGAENCTACGLGCSNGACILITMDYCVDADEDGYSITGSICGPIDCDDTNSSIWVDITGYYDNDGDGYGLSVNSTVSCTNGTLPTGFVTGGNDCNDVNLNVHPGVTDTPGDGIDQDCNGADATVIAPTGDGGSGGGYRRCTSEWKCTNWDYCNVDLKQSRTCTDLKNCEKPKVEVQNCSKCDESWSCSLWSECQNGINNRNCYDEHNCGTVKQKPALQKGCTQTMPPGPPPGRITYQQPYVPPPIEQQPAVITEESFWSKYKAFIISIPLALILIVVIIFVAVHYLHPGKKMAYNINDLMEWIKKEKAMGTSNDDIKSILKQHTGWTDTEINQAFKNL